MSDNILREAEAAVFGPREGGYGHPARNFQRTADLWNGYLSALGHFDVDLSVLDVSHMMILLKMARLMETPTHRDSHVDIAGYAEAGARAVGVDE